MTFLGQQNPNIERARDKWGWVMAFGLLLILFSLILLGNLVATTVASVVFFGVMLIIAGIFHLSQLFFSRSKGHVTFWIITGLLYVLAGVFLMRNPVLASGLFTIIVGVSLAVAGGFRLYLGMSMRPMQGWGGTIFSGAVIIFAAVMIASSFPQNSLWLLGLFVAVDFLIYGVSMVLFALALKPDKNV